MEKHAWTDVFPGTITVTDAEGTVIEINQKSANELFKNDGGYDVLGRNAIECHPKRIQEKVRKMYRDHAFNVYSITKGGKKYLVYQAPYFIKEEFSGMVELSLEIPDHIPHFDRDNPEKK